MSEAEIVARAKAEVQAIKFLTVEKMIQLTGAKISPQNLILLNRKLNKIAK